jgi:Asp-tRNA(Asn)/Glu-tRNA(Gln) amidotransferase A subunit family amidase
MYVKIKNKIHRANATGISLIGRAFDDELLFRVARQFQRTRDLPLGATQHR